MAENDARGDLGVETPLEQVPLVRSGWPTPLPGDRMSYVKQVGVDTRLTRLWFLGRDPREC